MVELAFFHQGKLSALFDKDTFDIDQTIWIDCVLDKKEDLKNNTVLKKVMPHVDLDKLHSVMNRKHEALYVDKDGRAFLRLLVLPKKNLRSHHYILLILNKTHVFTIRPDNVEIFSEFYEKEHLGFVTPADVIHGLFAFLIDKVAEQIEDKTEAIDELFQKIIALERNMKRKAELEKTIENVTLSGKFLVLSQENLTNYARILDFLIHDDRMVDLLGRQYDLTLKKMTLLLDILSSLNNSIIYLSQNLTYLSDCVRNMVGLRQNRSMLILSVVAAFFMPPNVLMQAFSIPFKENYHIEPAAGLCIALSVLIIIFICTYLFMRNKFINNGK